MTKNGFTLVELLAVIIILAVISLIATPIVINVIDKSRKSAAESSIAGYADTAKLTRIEYLFTNQTEDLYDLSDLEIVNSGEKVECEVVIYTKVCGIVLKKCVLENNDNTYYYYDNKIYYEEDAEMEDYCSEPVFSN